MIYMLVDLFCQATYSVVHSQSLKSPFDIMNMTKILWEWCFNLLSNPHLI